MNPTSSYNPNGNVGKTLASVFGTQFETGPVGSVAAEFTSEVAPQAEKHLNRARYEIRQAAAHRFEVLLKSLSVGDQRCDAFGTVEALNRPAVVRMAQSAITQVEQESTIDLLNAELGYFIQQVSGDLEEVSWFRRLAEQVAACRADQPLEVLCDRVLPQLRELLFAESIAVMLPDNDGYRVAGLDAAEDLGWHQHAETIIQQSAEAACAGAVVHNTGFPTQQDTDLPPAINGFVTVQIGTADQRFGWLIAINRSEQELAAAHHNSCQSRGSEEEFGTHEATLMESAAVLLATHAANWELFQEQERTLLGVVTAMVNALDARDPYTRGHSHRVALIGRRLATAVGMSADEAEDVFMTGLLHDIGKIGVPDHVLLKNGPLDPDERKQIEKHTIIGHAILEPVAQLNHVLPGVLHHHEKMDGTGYPHKLSGQNIPVAGRILAVADAFDAMTTSRPYRQAMPVVEAVQILLEGVGTHWDETVVDAFFQSLSDIHRIYEQHGTNCDEQQESLLQFGRFEDLSHSRLAGLEELAHGTAERAT